MADFQRKIVVTADTSGLKKAANDVQAFGRGVDGASDYLRKMKAQLDPAAFRSLAASMQPVIAAEKQMAAEARKTQTEALKAAEAGQKRVLSETRAAEALRKQFDSSYANASRYAGIEAQVARQVELRNLTVEQGNAILAGAATRYKQYGGAAVAANENVAGSFRQADSALDGYRRSLTLTEARMDAMRGHAAKVGAALTEFRMLAAGALAGAGLGGAFAASGVIETATEFQKLGASLKTVTGSSEAAERAFAFIRQFAAETPYTLQQVTESFIKLQSLGLDPSRASLEAYGNTASAMGKPIMQFIEAVADAVTGENERLKEFGIRASKDGEKVSYTFQGVTKTIGNNAQEIEAYLKSIGQVQFGGAMAEQMKILPGVFGNAQDAIANFQNAIGEGGLSAAVQDATSDLTDFLNSNEDLARSLGAIAGAELTTFRTDMQSLVGDLTEGYRWTQATGDVIGEMAGAFSTGGAQVAGVAGGMTTAAQAFSDAWTASGRAIYDVLNGIIGAGVGAYQSLVATWDQLPAAFGALAKGAANALVTGLEVAVNGALAGVNKIVAGINSIAPEFAQVPELPAVDLSAYKASLTEAQAATGETIASIMSAAQSADYLGAGMDALAAPIGDAMNRISEAKAEIDKAASATGELGQAAMLTGEGFRLATGAAAGTADAIENGVTKPSKEATKALREAEAARKALFGEADSAVAEFFPMVAASEEAARLQSIINDTTNGLSDLQRSALGLKIDQNFRNAADEAQSLSGRTRELSREIRDAGDIGRDAFGGIFDALTGGGDIMDNLIGSLASVGGPIGTMDKLFVENAK